MLISTIRKTTMLKPYIKAGVGAILFVAGFFFSAADSPNYFWFGMSKLAGILCFFLLYLMTFPTEE